MASRRSPREAGLSRDATDRRGGAAGFGQDDRWVLDGNYFTAGAVEVVWPRADTILWLDLARWVTVPRVVRRTFTRATRRTELWSGNRESLHLALRPDSIIWCAWREHPKYNRRYSDLVSDGDGHDPKWVRLRSPRAVRQWIAELPG